MIFHIFHIFHFTLQDLVSKIQWNKGEKYSEVKVNKFLLKVKYSIFINYAIKI